MIIRFSGYSTKSLLPVMVVVALFLLPTIAICQSPQHLSKRFPAGKKVHIELKNIFGTITVETWNRDEVRLSATMESPKAQVVPRMMDQTLVIDVIGDNRGRGEVGDVNFKLEVPVDSSVDLETKRGNIFVRNLRG